MNTKSTLTIFLTLVLSTSFRCAQAESTPTSGTEDKQALLQIIQNAPQGWETVTSSAAPSDSKQQLLAEYHVTGAAATAFQRGQRQVIVRVYHFPNAAAAYGAYTCLREGSSTVVPRGDGSSEDDDSITFWQGSYLFMLQTTASEDEEAKEMMRSLADQFGKAVIERAAIPIIVARLPKIDRVKGSEHLVMGPVGGKMYLPIPYVSFLKLEQAQSAIADYQFMATKERLKLLLIHFPDAKLALQAFQDYVGNLMGSHTCQSTASTAMFKMPDSYMYLQVGGTNLLLIAGAHKKDSALLLAKELVAGRN